MSTPSEIPNWAGRVIDDENAEEEVEEEELVAGEKAYLADECAAEEIAKDTATKPAKKDKKFYYKAPEFQYAPGITHIKAEKVILANDPASSVFLYNTLVEAQKSTKKDGLALVARVVYTPRGFSKCSYDLYALIPCVSSHLRANKEDLTTDFAEQPLSTPNTPLKLLIGVTHINVTSQFAGPLAVTLLSNITSITPVNVFTTMPQTTYTHSALLTYPDPVPNPVNKKNPCLSRNPTPNPIPPLLYSLSTSASTLPYRRAAFLPPPNILFSLDAALLAHARVFNIPLHCYVAIDHVHHYPGEALIALEEPLLAIAHAATHAVTGGMSDDSGSGVGAGVENGVCVTVPGLPKGELQRARVYLAWRQAWPRAAVSLSHRDSAQHRIAHMTNKPIPSGIFA